MSIFSDCLSVWKIGRFEVRFYNLYYTTMKNTRTYLDLERFCDRKSFYGKCEARIENWKAYLKSYSTIVSIYNLEKNEYEEKWYYSMTTSRHQKAFERALGIY